MLFLIGIPVALLLIGVLYEGIGEMRDQQRYPPPGRLIRINKTSLHIRTIGSGDGPAVIFEAGIAASSVSWTPVQDAVSKFAFTVSYDRSGLAWSSPATHALTAAEMTDSLRALLQSVGVQPPYILVGHSFGALLTRLYADRWPSEVAGLVLVDPALLLEWSTPDEGRLKRLSRGINLSRRGALLARIGLVRLSLQLLFSGARAIPKLFSKLTSGDGHSVSERLVGEVRKLPADLWPAVQSHWCRPQSFESMARHLSVLPATAAEVGRAKPLGRIPVTIISGGHLTAEPCAEHEAIAASSERGNHIIARNTGHWVHLDQPGLVVEAIRAIIKPPMLNS